MDESTCFARPIRGGETVHAFWDPGQNHFLPGANSSTGTPLED